MTTTAVIMLGILGWVLAAILLALFLARVMRLNRPQAWEVELSPVPPAGNPDRDPTAEPMAQQPAEPMAQQPAEPMAQQPAEPMAQQPAEPMGRQPAEPVGRQPAEAMVGFPAEPMRFVGRAEAMAAASSALAPASGHTAVVFHGMTGVGKTTCAVQLAYRHQRAFRTSVFWSAPADPDQYGEALRLLAVAVAEQLAEYGFAMVQEIASVDRLERFLPTFTSVFADADLLLVLDNLETLLTPDGQWRDLRWAPLIGALTDHAGTSRVILTSRVEPAGLNPDTVVIRRVHTLSRDESLLLVRELPNLRALLPSAAEPDRAEPDRAEPDRAGPGDTDPALGRRMFTLAQGHPALLELADAAAADPSRLAFQLAEVDAAVDGAAVDGAALAAFLTEGDTRLDAEQLRQIFTAWTVSVAATLPAPARLLLQALCRIEENDRSVAVVDVTWAALWRRLDQPGEPPPIASLVATLVPTALVTTDPNVPVRYRIHPGVVEAIHAVTPEPVKAAVDAQLADWWTAAADGWGIEQQQAGEDTSRFTVRVTLAAARYLLRQHDCNAASCLLERALIRDRYSLITSLAVAPLLRRVAESTGALQDLVVLGAALRKVDPGESETLLRRAYDQATTDGEYQLASATAGDLASLLRDQGRILEALTLVDQKIEHTSRAGFGFWTQLSDQGRRLQLLGMLGHHEQVLLDLPAVRARMADLPDQRASNDRVSPWNVREGVLDVGRLSAMALERWEEALDLNDEIASTKRHRGAGRYETARTRFNDYLPLLHLGRLADVDQLLRDCQDVFDAAGDTTQLAVVYGARAELEDKRDHPAGAVDLQRTSLSLWYVHPNPGQIATAHYHLANYLSRTVGSSAEQRAHRLTAALLDHLTGNTQELTRALSVLASELRGGAGGAEAQGLPAASVLAATPVLPTTLAEIIRLVDAGDGIRFGTLVVALCPDSATAEHGLADLMKAAAISAD